MFIFWFGTFRCIGLSITFFIIHYTTSQNIILSFNLQYLLSLMKLYANFWSILSCLYFHWSIASFILLLCAVNGQFLSCSVICWRWSWVQVWRTGFRPDTIFKLVLRSFQDPDPKPPWILYTSNWCWTNCCTDCNVVRSSKHIVHAYR